MDTNLAAGYLAILLVLLSGAGFVIFRQVLKTRRIESTFAELQKKLTKEKGTTQEFYELGGIYLKKKLYSQAISTLQKALKAAEEDEENATSIYNGLGFAYFAQEQYDLAIRQYKEALRLEPNYITALNNLGHAYERKSLTAQAVETYEQVLKSEPQNKTAKRRLDLLRRRDTRTSE